jgi:hypothetical protein
MIPRRNNPGQIPENREAIQLKEAVEQGSVLLAFQSLPRRRARSHRYQRLAVDVVGTGSQSKLDRQSDMTDIEAPR